VPLKYEPQSVANVLGTAESLKKAAEQLTQVAMDMQQHGLNEALFPWTQHQWTCLDIITKLAGQSVADLPVQIAARQQGRLSKFDLLRSKAELRANQRKRQRERETIGSPHG
jgi:hypothetical protein